MKKYLIVYQVYSKVDDVSISNSYTFLIQNHFPTESELLVQVMKFVTNDAWGVRFVKCNEITELEYAKYYI